MHEDLKPLFFLSLFPHPSRTQNQRTHIWVVSEKDHPTIRHRDKAPVEQMSYAVLRRPGDMVFKKLCDLPSVFVFLPVSVLGLNDLLNALRRDVGVPAAAILFATALPVAAVANSDAVDDEEPENSSIEDVLDEAPDIRIYRTREEQREAGLKHEVTPWLTLSGLAEIEVTDDNFSIDHGRDDSSGREEAANIQLGLAVDVFELAQFETVIEYDTDVDDWEVEEAFATFEHGPWEFSMGRQYTPFGVYFSNFVSGPLLEFGETRAERAFILAYGPTDALEMSLTTYRGNARERGDNAERWDWVFAMEAEIDGNWSAGWSYQTDLADADSRLLEDENDRYSRRVPAVSGYFLWTDQRYEFTLEALGAVRSFKELDNDRDRPWAWNAEVVYFFDNHNIDLAFRVEGSNELEGEPHLQFGPALTWRIGKYASLTLEYLHGEFKDQIATNDDDEPYDHVDRVGGILTVEF